MELDAAAVLAEMNAYRASQGLRPLALDPRLVQAASDRATDMFARHYFNHVSPDGAQPFDAALRRGYDYVKIGENLAAGQRSAREVVADWMQSPGHRANVLEPSFADCGIAIVAGRPDVAGARGYTFVALYGRR